MYQPNYQITDALVNLIAKIESLRQQIQTSYILPQREVELRYRATVEATHSSTSIEGNPLNLQQVAKILGEKKALTRRQYAEIEVQNYKKALDFIDKRQVTGKPITVKDILKLHQIVAKQLITDEQKIGRWRNNLVYLENHLGQVLYTAALTKSVPDEVEQLLTWLNEKALTIHPVIAAAILHFQFVSIHPFADGNGRTTRLLTALYLGLRQYDFRHCLVLDSYYAVDKKAYYLALHQAQGQNYQQAKNANLNSWLSYFTEGFLAAAKILAAEVAILATVAEKQEAIISRAETDLLSYIQQFGSITTFEAQAVLPELSRRSIQRKLKSLVDKNYLKAQGATNESKYLLKKNRARS